MGLIATLLIFEVTNLDRWVQQHLYNPSTASWLWDRHEPYAKAILYDGARICLGIYGLGLIIALIKNWRQQGDPDLRIGLFIALLTLVLLPTLVGALKSTTNLPCPRKLSDYGGTYTYVHLFESRPAMSERPQKCFPAGHASGGFALLALPLLAKSRRRKIQLLVGALSVGWILGLYKMAIGEHFLSHTLVSMFLAWLVVYSLKAIADRFFTRTAY